MSSHFPPKKWPLIGKPARSANHRPVFFLQEIACRYIFISNLSLLCLKYLHNAILEKNWIQLRTIQGRTYCSSNIFFSYCSTLCEKVQQVLCQPFHVITVTHYLDSFSKSVAKRFSKQLTR